MLVILATASQRHPLTPGREYVVGRGPGADITVDGRRVSRRHCAVSLSGSTWRVRDLRSSNGTFVAGERVTEREGSGAVGVALGAPDGPEFTLELVSEPGTGPTPAFEHQPSGGSSANTMVGAPAPATPSGGVVGGEAYVIPDQAEYGLAQTAIHRLGNLLRIGRDPSNDIEIPDLVVSRHHAHIRRHDGVVEVFDLGSANGTYVNGHRVAGAPLVAGDVVGIGRTSLLFDGTALRRLEESEGLAFSAHGLTVEVGSGHTKKTLMHDVSFELKPRSVLAVIGPSGSGKSTLLNALTGQRPADRGRVHYAGRDLYAQYDELRNRIGMVPQDDLLHSQLTVGKALDYGAALRFPAETTRAERTERVGEVMTELGLGERRELRIDKLSGGQRKRTSVAIELLTKPSLLFLDEPTSGLDPGLDLQVMQLLRRLADEGRTVVVVTHSVANLDRCDNVMILAPGGYLAYFGPPAEAPGYFGVTDYAQIFLTMETQPGAYWDQRFRDSQYSTATDAQPTPASQHESLSTIRQQSFLSQLWTLSRRYTSVISADKAYLAFLVVLPLMLAGVGFLVGLDQGLGSGGGDPSGVGPPNGGARFVLMVLVVGAAFTGTASSIQELVKERTIYQRERAIGLSRAAYLLSKLLVLGVITAAQATLFAGLALAGRPGPDEGVLLPNGTLEIIVVCAALAVASMALGLALSALIPTADVALPALVVVTMVQMVLSGAVPIRFDAILDLVGWLTPSYWAFSAMAATVDLGFLSADPDAPSLWDHTTTTWAQDMAALGAWFTVYVVVAYLLLRRSEPKRR